MDQYFFKPLFFVIFFVGCVAYMNYDYSIRLYNIGNKTIDEVEIVSQKGYWHNAGVIIADAWKTYIGPIDYPPSDEFTLSWIDSNQQKHSQKVDLRPLVKNGFRGKIIFKINADNEVSIEARPRTKR